MYNSLKSVHIYQQKALSKGKKVVKIIAVVCEFFRQNMFCVMCFSMVVAVMVLVKAVVAVMVAAVMEVAVLVVAVAAVSICFPTYPDNQCQKATWWH